MCRKNGVNEKGGTAHCHSPFDQLLTRWRLHDEHRNDDECKPQDKQSNKNIEEQRRVVFFLRRSILRFRFHANLRLNRCHIRGRTSRRNDQPELLYSQYSIQDMRSAAAVPKHVGSTTDIKRVAGSRLVNHCAERRRPVGAGFDTSGIRHDRKRKKRRAGVSVDEV